MKVIKIILVVALIGFLLAGAICTWAWNDINAPVQHTMAGKPVNIALGSSTDQIVQKLQAVGIIQHGSTFKLYIKLQGVGSLIKAGDYLFPSPIAPKDVLQKLVEGGEAANKLTIIEGWTRWDIAHAMAAIPTLKLKNADQALALMNDTSSIKDLDPSATSLEGYMFPDTYFVQSTTTAKEVLESSVDHFHQVWKKDLAELATSSKQSAHDVVTVGSIIETEAKLPGERPVVASVIYNRLGQHIALSVDSTIVYASKLAGKWKNNGIVYLSDVNRDSPYNTRKVAGLPPGPVSNPGLSSLKAALEPANTGFIYYVREPSRNDGAHNFYVDAAGFETGVQALRNWERLHRGGAAKPTASTKPAAAVVSKPITTAPINHHPAPVVAPVQLKPHPPEPTDHKKADTKTHSGATSTSVHKPQTVTKPKAQTHKPAQKSKSKTMAHPKQKQTKHQKSSRHKK